MRSILCLISFISIMVLAGCQQDYYLVPVNRNPPTIEVTNDPDAPDDGHLIITNVVPPADTTTPADTPEDEEPTEGPDHIECPDRILYNPRYFAESPEEVVGYPVLTMSSPNAISIAPGNAVNLVFTITATCGAIHWGGGEIYLAPSGNFGNWNQPFYGYNQAPMPIEDIAMGDTMTIRSYQTVHADDGQLFWPARENDWSPDNEFVGRDLEEGESVTYRFTFTRTEIIPSGETFLLGLIDGKWSDPVTGADFDLDNNFYNPVAVTVTE